MDLNIAKQTSHLTFAIGEETVFVMHEGQFVTRDTFAKIFNALKVECKDMHFLLTMFLFVLCLSSARVVHFPICFSFQLGNNHAFFKLKVCSLTWRLRCKCSCQWSLQ